MAEREDSRSSAKNTGSNSRGTGRGTAPYVLTEDSHHSEHGKPRTILQALSDVQQYYVIESRGGDVPTEMFTWQMMLDYYMVGFRSAVKEGFVFMIMIPIVYFWFLPRLVNPDWSTRALFEFIAVIPIIAYTAICANMSRYYSGNIGRRAINSLFMGRSSMLIIKAFIIYVAFALIEHMGTPDRAWSFFRHFGDTASYALYKWFFEIKPLLMPTAHKCGWVLMAGAVIPYLTMWFLMKYRKARSERNLKYISGG